MRDSHAKLRAVNAELEEIERQTLRRSPADLPTPPRSQPLPLNSQPPPRPTVTARLESLAPEPFLHSPWDRGQYSAPSPSLPPLAADRLDAQFDRLQAQADLINHLADQQEAAVLELKTLAEAIDYACRYEDLDASQMPPLCCYQSASVPQIVQDQNGTYQVTSRPIDWYKAEKDAHRMAEQLRLLKQVRQHRGWQQRYGSAPDRPASDEGWQDEPSPGSVLEGMGQVWRWVTQRRPRSPHRSGTGSPSRSSPRRTPSSFRGDWQDAIFWLLGAAVMRIVAEGLRAQFPGLGLVVMALLLLPGAIALYQAQNNPKSGFVLGYRLLLIMVGLLLGGRL